MSYILEALKKAQAERQLGSAPTIHAMPIQAAPAASSAGARTPLWIAAAVVGTLIVVGAVLWWRGPQVAPAVLAVEPIVAEPALTVAPPVVVAQAPLPVAPAPAVMPASPAPAQAAAPVAPPVAVPVPVAPARAAVAAPAPLVAAARPAPVPVPVPVPPPPPPPVIEAAGPEENLPFMSQLPEPQRSEVPKVTFGGYMYSRNPADRMLIVDKVLRREGEEVAPGLILEQLQSKAAVLNYRGTRYRLAY